MTSTIAAEYTFRDKLAEGERGERFIAEALKDYGKVYLVPDMGFQRVGIDAVFVSDRYGYTSLQIKQCRRAQKSGNAFIEVAILDENKQNPSLGWAMKTVAQHVAYWAVGTGRVYLMETMKVKREIPTWRAHYRTAYSRSSENGRVWHGEGICVPLDVIEATVCTDVLDVIENV